MRKVRLVKVKGEWMEVISFNIVKQKGLAKTLDGGAMEYDPRDVEESKEYIEELR